MPTTASHWQRYQHHLYRCDDPDFSLDISRMDFGDDFMESMAARCAHAFAELLRLEAGEKVNVDEDRMVGHYWLRNPALAPTTELRDEIERALAETKAFAHGIHSGEIFNPSGEKFENLLVIGIGGSALGPQFVFDALADVTDTMPTWFFDNTDPAGIDRDLAQLGGRLDKTLAIVISKSGGTPETRNGMLEAEAAYQRAGLDFGRHAIAITGPGSKLDKHAETNNWIGRFPMADWVGGRSSVTSVVGLVAMALQKIDITRFLAGASTMDDKTRVAEIAKNPAMLLALMWHHAGEGRGAKDMVVLPYKDSLQLFSKYLQQLVMESLGKERDLDGKVVHQGIAVYGNKGSTDQHAYVQQLRDGLNNFFATFIEVRRGRDGESITVDGDDTTGDFLQGFLRGTRAALHDNGRESITISIDRVTPHTVGALIALFERAVTLYASLVNINAYHQPGVEAGKKAAAGFLELLGKVRGALEDAREPVSAAAVAEQLDADPETVYHILNHLAANQPGIKVARGTGPGEDRFG